MSSFQDTISGSLLPVFRQVLKAILEELDAFKMTFDHEKIFLIQEMDKNWFTHSLVESVESRLETFSTFFSYSEEAQTRTREESLQAILNLIGIVATAGALTEIINYFDPFFRLPFNERLDELVLSVSAVIVIFIISTCLGRLIRNDK